MGNSRAKCSNILYQDIGTLVSVESMAKQYPNGKAWVPGPPESFSPAIEIIHTEE